MSLHSSKDDSRVTHGDFSSQITDKAQFLLFLKIS